MTSEQCLNKILQNTSTDSQCWKYAGQILDDLKMLEIIKRIIKDDTSYVNINYADNKIYIDGCAEYLTKEEKQFVINYIKEIKNESN